MEYNFLGYCRSLFLGLEKNFFIYSINTKAVKMKGGKNEPQNLRVFCFLCPNTHGNRNKCKALVNLIQKSLVICGHCMERIT